LLQAMSTGRLLPAAAPTVATRPARRQRALPARRQGQRGGLASGWRSGTRCMRAWSSLRWKWLGCSTLTSG